MSKKDVTPNHTQIRAAVRAAITHLDALSYELEKADDDDAHIDKEIKAFIQVLQDKLKETPPQ